MSSRETVLAEELSQAQRSNVFLQTELDTAVTEAVCATDALEQCAEQASATLRSRNQIREAEAKLVAPPSELGGGEIAALAQALVAAESALEAALTERDDLADALGGARSELSKSNAHGISSPSGHNRAMALEQQLCNFEAEARAGRTEFMAERARAQMLQTEFLQSRVECARSSEEAAAKAAQLRDVLADARADNRRLTEELVTSLLEQEADIETRMVNAENVTLPPSPSGEEDTSLLQGRSAANRQVLSALRPWAVSLCKESSQWDAEQVAQARIVNDEVDRLRQELASAWAENERQAGQFVTSLAEMQTQLSSLQLGVNSEDPRRWASR